MLLISLIGEQPIPNLLPASYLKADENLLVATENPGSQKAAQRLSRLLPGCKVKQLKQGYQVSAILSSLQDWVGERADVVVNLTGGTKPMSLAAFELATARKYPCVYYQTEAQQPSAPQKGFLYYYQVNDSRELTLENRIELPGNLLTLTDYLKAHMDDFKEAGASQDSGGELEKAVYASLRNGVDEIMAGVKPEGMKDQLEADILIRCGLQVAVIEVKTGGSGSGKHAVDQLTSIAAREYLGTYAQRFLVMQRSQEDRFKPLAQALRVTVIELTEYQSGKPLSQKDAQLLRDKIAEKLPIRKG